LWNLGSTVIAPYDPRFRADRSFVVAAWVRPSGYDAATRAAVSIGSTGKFSPIQLAYRPEYKRWGVLAIVDGAGNGKWALSDNEAATYQNQDGWVHLAAVYDAQKHSVTLYVNGVSQATEPTSGTTSQRVDLAHPGIWWAGANTTLVEQGRDVLVGRATFAGYSTGQWKGAIREVRVFSGVLPEACTDVPACMTQLPVR
jgi:hypothetical protein